MNIVSLNLRLAQANKNIGVKEKGYAMDEIKEASFNESYFEQTDLKIFNFKEEDLKRFNYI